MPFRVKNSQLQTYGLTNFLADISIQLALPIIDGALDNTKIRLVICKQHCQCRIANLSSFEIFP